MAHDEEVEDLGDLESTLPAASGAKEGIVGQLAPPSDAGEDPMPAAVPTGEDTSVLAVAPTAEDTAASVGPSQVVG
jgi:hypothetical protein